MKSKLFRYFILSLFALNLGCSIDASILSSQSTQLIQKPSFDISSAPKDVPENYPYFTRLPLQNPTGTVVYSLEGNTCQNLTINSTTAELKGVLGHKDTETCSFSVKALIDGTEEIVSDPIQLEFTPSLEISFSTPVETIKVGALGKTVQLNFTPAPPFSSYLPYELVSHENPDQDFFTGLSNRGEILVQGGQTSQNLTFEVPNSVSLSQTDYQSLYLTAGTSTHRPQIDLSIYQNDPATVVDLEINSVGSVCAVTSTGSLYCWGSSSNGEFGTGAVSENFSRPQQFASATPWQRISMNDQTSCGINDGRLYCWGANSYGQVGAGGTSLNILVPYQVDSSTDWTDVSTSVTTCGINAGELFCWGYNANGAVGNGSTGGNVLVPTKIGSLTNWQMVAVGPSHTCGIAGGNLYCWGSNSAGKVGTGAPTATYNTPQLINTGGWTNVTAGQDNSCGVKDGKLFCWGNNMWGQSIHLENVPTQIGTDTTWSSVHNDWTTTCGINNGSLYCWGTFTGFAPGTMGVVDAGPGWTKFKTTSYTKGCGIKNGLAQCFSGATALGSGALGNGKASGNLSTPLKLGTQNWDLISKGQNYSCGIQSGELYCWGTANNSGQLGNGTTTLAENIPRKIDNSKNWTHIAVERNFSAGIRGGELYWWGYNSTTGLNVTTPTRVGSDSNWTHISVSGQLCGIESGRLFCWNTGANPSQVGSSSTWTFVSVGSVHQCGIDAGKLYCWGSNGSGQLGDGTTNQAASPVQIGTLSDWTYVSASRHPGVGGTEHTCGIRGGLLFCWGNNSAGQNGNGSISGQQLVPVQITGLNGWTRVETSQGNACGIQSGKLFCWGQNSSGQVGTGAGFSTNQTTPAQVGTDSDWTDISIIQYGVLGIKSQKLYGWGRGAQFLSNPNIPSVILDIY